MTLPIPTEMTAAVGQILTAAAWNSNVRDGINYLMNPPIFVGYQAVSQNVVSSGSTFVAVSFDSEQVDTYGGHSTSTNNSRYTAQVAGWYLAVGQVGVGSNATGLRAAALRINGVTLTPGFEVEIAPNGAGATLLQVAGLVFLNVGDFLDVAILQNSGATLALAANLSLLAALWVHA